MKALDLRIGKELFSLMLDGRIRPEHLQAFLANPDSVFTGDWTEILLASIPRGYYIGQSLAGGAKKDEPPILAGDTVLFSATGQLSPIQVPEDKARILMWGDQTLATKPVDDLHIPWRFGFHSPEPYYVEETPTGRNMVFGETKFPLPDMLKLHSLTFARSTITLVGETSMGMFVRSLPWVGPAPTERTYYHPKIDDFKMPHPILVNGIPVYIAEDTEPDHHEFIVWGNKPPKQKFKVVSRIAVSEDSSTIYYFAITTARQDYLLVQETSEGEFTSQAILPSTQDMANSPVLSGRYLFYRIYYGPEKQQVIRREIDTGEEVEFPLFGAIRDITNIGDQPIYAARDGRGWCLIQETRGSTCHYTYDDVGTPIIFGNNILCPAMKGGKWLVVWIRGEEKIESNLYDQVFSLHVKDNLIIFGARKGRRLFRVVRNITM